MGSVPLPDNPGEGNDVNVIDPGTPQRPGGSIGRGPGGDDIIDQHHPASIELFEQPGRHRERAGNIARPRITRQPDLLAGMAHPPQPVAHRREPGVPADLARQQHRLVEPPQCLAAPVQRYRHQH